MTVQTASAKALRMLPTAPFSEMPEQAPGLASRPTPSPSSQLVTVPVVAPAAGAP